MYKIVQKCAKFAKMCKTVQNMCKNVQKGAQICKNIQKLKIMKINEFYKYDNNFF